jgi:anti-sigma regulatory factor (Ser/Thr protein kinase)/Fe-S-cluster-containing hydrogenase component 2
VEFLSYDIESMDFRQAGGASRALKERLKLIGAEAEAIRRAMIAAYEAEMNVVIHSVGGRLEASLSDSQVDVDVVDSGPGIPNIDKAMVEGYSTASAEARALGFGAGLGLPNIKKNSDRLRLTSRVGEGTRLSFTVYLRPGVTDGAHPISLHASADRCRDCRACLGACPTNAMRVRGGRPSVLEHLCVDCTQCIAACPFGALATREEVTTLDDLAYKDKLVLVVPPALLADCGPQHSPAAVLAALDSLGFADVLVSEPHEAALRAATAAWSAEGPRPAITPACPAAVDLVELRFPSLVKHLAPFDSPWEALQAAYVGRPAAYVVSCPSQRSALLAGGAAVPRGGDAPRDEYLAPQVVRQAVMAKLASGDATGLGAVHGPDARAHTDAPSADLLTVTGAAHVIAVLEELEDGLLDDVGVVEPYLCEGGCLGSPLFSEDHHVAARRWAQGRAAVEAATADRGATGAATAAPRRRPYAARPGIRLDADMGKAIQKLGRLQATIDSLPGKDCGACGAPTCAALGEDVVMERAAIGLCPYLKPGEKEGRS